MNVIGFYESYKCDKYLSVQMELMESNLLDYLNSYYEQLGRQQKLAIFCQVVQGVSHCHQMGYMHRNVKM